jgi:hypothetical protein
MPNPYSKECKSLIGKIETADSVDHVNAYYVDLNRVVLLLAGERVRALTEKKASGNWPKLKNPPDMDTDKDA